jgi:hypothetical protein
MCFAKPLTMALHRTALLHLACYEGLLYWMATMGRDRSLPDHLLKVEVRKLVEKLECAGCRFTSETYFSRQALEAVVGRDLGEAFVLDPWEANCGADWR